VTPSTNGKPIEGLSEEERRKELRLRYTGALVTMVKQELGTAAARLIAVYPLVPEQEFVDMALEMFRKVGQEVFMRSMEARDAIPVSPKD
jgi:hypothetical protein